MAVSSTLSCLDQLTQILNVLSQTEALLTQLVVAQVTVQVKSCPMEKNSFVWKCPRTAVSRCLPCVFILVQVCAVEDGGETHQKDPEDLAVLPRVPCSVLILLL